MTAEGSSDAPEVGKRSLWFLRGITIAVAVVVAAFVVHALVGLVSDDEGEGIAEPEPTTTVQVTTTVAPSFEDTPDPADVADTDLAPDADPELDQFVASAVEFIEQVRAEPFPEQPVVEVVTEAEFIDTLRADLDETFAEDPDLIATATANYRSLGLIGPTDRIDDIYDQFIEAGVLGVYFPAEDRMLVRAGDGLTLLTKAVIVHELVHAYDDQRFDLERMDDVDDTTELPWTYSAVTEGSASYVESLWRDQLSSSERQDLLAEELAFGDVDLLERFDISFLILEVSRYEYGQRWIERIVERDGVAGIDAALVNPPLTSEQIIEPLDAPGREPVSVPMPEVEGNVVWQGAAGQAVLDALFTGSFTAGPEASSGWAGDAVTIYELDGQSCIRWDLAADTPTDLDELRAGLQSWVDAKGGSVTNAGELVRLDRCA